MSDSVHVCSLCSDICVYDRPIGLDVLVMAFITARLKADYLRLSECRL